MTFFYWEKTSKDFGYVHTFGFMYINNRTQRVQ